MPKSIIDIDVNDDQFKRFLELFAEHQEALKSLPEDWKGVEEASASATVPLEGMTAALMAHVALIREGIAAENEAEAARKKSADAEIKRNKDEDDREKARRKAQTDAMEKTKTFWRDTATMTADVARNTADIAKSVVWDVAKGAAFGLIGAGAGLFGLDALANVVGQQRFQAQGLGVPTSESQAFDVNFGKRLVSGDFLSNIQGAQTDITRNWQFGQLGISQDEVHRADAAELGIDVIKKANELWRDNPTQHNQQFMAAHGLAGLMSFQDWSRVGQQTPAELRSYEQQYAKDSQTMGETDPIQQKWQNFGIQLDRAGNQMQKTLVDGLTPLTGPLSDLSAALTGALGDLLKNPHMKEWIEDLAGGLKELGGYLKSEQFNTDLHTFMDDIEWAAHKLGSAVRWMLDHIPGASPPLPTADPMSIGNQSAMPDGEQIKQRWDANARGLPGVNADFLSPLLHPHGGKNAFDFGGVSKFYGLPASLWETSGMIESGLNPATPDSVVTNKKTGATTHYQGMWQMGPAMQAEYGVKDPMNPTQEANAYGRAMDDYLNLYHGDLKKAVAAYDWGPGNLQDDIRQHGDDWLSFAPAETQAYVKRMVAGVGTDTVTPNLAAAPSPPSAPSGGRSVASATPIPHPGQVTVKVMNQTGAQVAVLANGVRQ